MQQGMRVEIPLLAGLVGYTYSSRVIRATNSYFDSSVSNRPASDDYAKTTTELQTPTAYGTSTDIYVNWNIDVDDGLDVGVDNGTADGDATADDPWDFGTATQYPVLKVDFNGDGTATAAEFGTQRVTKFKRTTYDFVARAGTTAGTVVDTVRAYAVDYAYTLSYSISSQKTRLCRSHYVWICLCHLR